MSPRAQISDRNVRTVLAALSRAHAISTGMYRRYLGSFNAALSAVKRLSGTRALELEAVIENLHAIAADGMLTPSRLPALFLTLDRNRHWWTTGPMLSSGQRVQFAGSQLVWQYYPGQGIELQQLGSWGQADWMYEAGPKYWRRLRSLVDELIPLAAERGGGPAWEYYFNFDGGTPPWTSAMSQGTAVQALTQTYEATHQGSYLALARRSLAVFKDGPPTGVAVPTSLGRRYLLYSFAPDAGEEVINGFLQSLIGLFDYATASGDAEGWRLFRAGDAEARAELPSYDTGAWSLYQPGQEDTLDYHELVTGFLEQLCTRTRANLYCTTAKHFRADLKEPPNIELLTRRLHVGGTLSIRFRVSKIARVGITIVLRGRTIFLTSATFPYGTHSFAVPALPRPGSYEIQLDGTDLAGNYKQTSWTVTAS
ncbi:MAG TPA: D-glucuronyl C5-epimerase family protein [Solirubrobacteraceae bacterium]|nr:D-glucuronyl C5-epimerase family protein [Solirubrobacteraceae bacterium]